MKPRFESEKKLSKAAEKRKEFIWRCTEEFVCNQLSDMTIPQQALAVLHIMSVVQTFSPDYKSKVRFVVDTKADDWYVLIGDGAKIGEKDHGQEDQEDR